MIWLTWRQFRTHASVALAALAALAVALIATGPRLVHLYLSSGVAACRLDCDNVRSSFLMQLRTGSTETLYWLGIGVVTLAPALIGVFWGAPLVARELETGTHRLAWNQSVTRTRWLAVKVAGVGLATVATAGLFSLAVTWWAAPIDAANLQLMQPHVFVARGIVPVGYAAFAFAVGLTAGILVRRTLPAMAITVAVVACAQLAMPLWVRAHLITPVTTVSALNTEHLSEMLIDNEYDQMHVAGVADVGNGWLLSNRTITPAGTPFTGPADHAACGVQASPQSCTNWLATLHLRQVLVYQPANRFWPLQWSETGIFLGLALLLIACSFWWVRRRLI